MTFNDYVKATRATWRDDDPERLQVAHAAMGLAGELGELRREQHFGASSIADELGDMCYYHARLCDLCVTESMASAFSYPDALKGYDRGAFERAVLSIVELTKKRTFHFHSEEVQEDMELRLKQLAEMLAWWCDRMSRDCTIEDIRRENIEKLRARYPDGFETGGGVREEEA